MLGSCGTQESGSAESRGGRAPRSASSFGTTGRSLASVDAVARLARGLDRFLGGFELRQILCLGGFVEGLRVLTELAGELLERLLGALLGLALLERTAKVCDLLGRFLDRFPVGRRGFDLLLQGGVELP